jgi:hypothetical protein
MEKLFIYRPLTKDAGAAYKLSSYIMGLYMNLARLEPVDLLEIK